MYTDSPSDAVETVALPLLRGLDREEVRGLSKGCKGSWWEILAYSPGSMISSSLKGNVDSLNAKAISNEDRIFNNLKLIVTFTWHCV